MDEFMDQPKRAEILRQPFMKLLRQCREQPLVALGWAGIDHDAEAASHWLKHGLPSVMVGKQWLPQELPPGFFDELGRSTTCDTPNFFGYQRGLGRGGH